MMYILVISTKFPTIWVYRWPYNNDLILLDFCDFWPHFALSRLLKQCSLFFKSYQFDFNANKSEFIILSHNQEIHQEEIYFMNKIIQTNCRHLGNRVGSKQNVLLSTFRNVDSKSKIKIFESN